MSVIHAPPCSALLFDLDGTLVDSRRDIASALNFALSALGREELALEAVLPLVGDGARALVARALGFDPASGDGLIDRGLAIFQGRYRERPCIETSLLPGALEALALGRPIALVTNKPRAITLPLLDALGIASRFRAVWAGDDGRLKPAPDGICAVAERLGVAIEHVWMVGDGPQDILAARAAGCISVYVPGFADREASTAARPSYFVAHLGELGGLLHAPSSHQSDPGSRPG